MWPQSSPRLCPFACGEGPVEGSWHWDLDEPRGRSIATTATSRVAAASLRDRARAAQLLAQVESENRILSERLGRRPWAHRRLPAPPGGTWGEHNPPPSWEAPEKLALGAVSKAGCARLAKYASPDPPS